MSAKPTLAYWDIRGYAEPIRNLLHYLNVDFEDKRYVPGPNFDRSAWLKEKFTLGLDFPNLPYYIDGNVKLTQTVAILRYIARKYKVDGDNDVDYAKVAVLEQQLQDNRLAFGRTAYAGDDFATLKEAYLNEQLPQSVEQLSKYLGANKFAIGDKVTYVDFLLYEFALIVKTLAPEVLAKYDNLKQFIGRVEALPSLQKYLKSRKPQTFNASISKWNAEY